jgi:uncharacterized protein (TIGR03435 family)
MNLFADMLCEFNWGYTLAIANIRRTHVALPMLLTALCATSALAQDPLASPLPASMKIPQYEVVSIRLATDFIEFRGAEDASDGTHIIDTLKGLVSYAYGVRPEFVSCEIKWCDSVTFDLRAKVADSDIADLQKLTHEQRGWMLKPTLAERFGLKLHSEARPLRVYDLVLAKGATKLHAHPANATPQTVFANGRPADGVMMFRGSEIKGYAVTISALAKTLSGSGLFSESVERPVVDKTGLQGTYDFDLKWTTEQTAIKPSDAVRNGSQLGDPQEDSAPSIFTALQEQLGLRLQPATDSAQMIVVDYAHMPSQN